MEAARYRMICRTETPYAEAVKAATSAYRDWLRRKSRHQEIDLDAFDAGEVRLGPNRTCERRAEHDAKGHRAGFLLREAENGGHWLTNLLLYRPSGDKGTWIWLDVEYSGERRDPAVPYLARLLLGSIDTRDHWAELRAEPVLVRPDEVDRVLDIVCDQDRRLPVVVASPHRQIPFGEWRDTVTAITGGLAGLASLYILDPTAADAFNEGIGDALQVYGGALRTYLPDVDPALPEEAPRHRVLSAKRAQADPYRAKRILAGLPMELAATAPLPAALSALRRPVRKVSGDGDHVKELASLRTQIAEYEQVFEEFARDEARRAASHASDRRERDGLAIALEESNRELNNSADLVRYLRGQLIEAGRAAAAYDVPPEETILPGDFAELRERLPELSNVEFTGSLGDLDDLDMRPNSGSWAQSAWRALLALDDYAGAVFGGRFQGGFHTWCAKNPLNGRIISPGGYAADESETTRNNPRRKAERTFPVPASVASGGRAVMTAHIRVGGGAGMSAPRMYLLDNASKDGRVYVGYIGPHLRITSTN